MNVDEGRVRRAYQEMHGTKATAGCLEDAQLVRAAAGELTRAEREQAMDHLGTCSRCAGEYRVLASLKPWADEAARHLEPGITAGTVAVRATHWLKYGSAAAAVILSFGIGVQVGFRSPGEERAASNAPQAAGSTGLASRTAAETERQLADLRAQLQDATARARQQDLAIEELRRPAQPMPHVNVPIVDLEPADLRRGPNGAPRPIDLPTTTTLVTFVLTPTRQVPTGTYGVELRDRQDQLVWKASGLSASTDNTFTVAVPRTLLPAGESHVRLLVESAGRPELVEDWTVRISYR